MGNTVFERNYEIVEKDDRATAVFERAFAPGGFMEEFTKKMDAIPKVVVPKDKENYDYLLNRAMTLQSGIMVGFAALLTMSTGTHISTYI